MGNYYSVCQDSLTIFAAKHLEIYTPELEILENVIEQIEHLACVLK